jgi:hypothetical protein
MTIGNLSISYPDFQLNTVIDPEQMDTNNLELVTKINQIITKYNAITSSEIPVLPIGGLAGTDIQTVLTSLKTYTDSKDSDLRLLITTLNTYVTNQDAILLTNIETHKSNVNNPHNVTPAQLSVYTKAELQPYLRGGDTVIRYDVFTIVNSNLGNSTFTYSDKNNVIYTGVITPEGYQTFTLTQGEYALAQNRIDATINDTLQRSVASGGLIETSINKVTLTSPEGTGAEITFKYFEKVGIVGTGTTILSPTQPPSGFFWYKELP